jgi:hypothetical protein
MGVSKSLFIVIAHMEGYDPDMRVVEAVSEDEAGEAMTNYLSSIYGEQEVYLDSVTPLDLAIESKLEA